MAYRFTNTDKWKDAWYSALKPIEKLLFNYLCDNCDIAGFIEINIKHWSIDIGTDQRQIEGALKGLARGLIISNTNDCFYVRKFLKHQKNLPLNPNNKAHMGILKRFELYSYKFDIKDINEFIEGALKGLGSPTGIGNGIGNGIGKKEDTTTKLSDSKKFIPPTLEEFQKYFEEFGYSIEVAERAWNGYNVADWYDSKGNKIKNWKQKCHNVWFTEENKAKISREAEVKSW